MSTIASPRPQAPPHPPSPAPSSQRTSLDTIRTSSPARTPQLSTVQFPSTQAPQTTRRNRAALRDYYNLKNAAPADASSSAQHEDALVKESELDREGFDAEEFVVGLLGREGLEGVLRVEGGLVNEIKSLDGERKALVYDNYSKLITATDTIKKMRANMDPLAPTTSTLSPAVAHIAVTAEDLAQKLQPKGTEKEKREASEEKERVKREKDTVRWVLDAPRRLSNMGGEEKEEEWKVVEGLLDKWEGVEGVEKIREECRKVMEDGSEEEKE